MFHDVVSVSLNKDSWEATVDPADDFDELAVLNRTLIEPLPALSGEAIAAAGRSFSALTVCSFDGTHPRHFDFLSQEGLKATSTLMATAECLGKLPSAARLTQYRFIPKAKEGNRATALFTGLYLCWARAKLLCRLA